MGFKGPAFLMGLQQLQFQGSPYNLGAVEGPCDCDT